MHPLLYSKNNPTYLNLATKHCQIFQQLQQLAKYCNPALKKASRKLETEYTDVFALTFFLLVSVLQIWLPVFHRRYTLSIPVGENRET